MPNALTMKPGAGRKTAPPKRGKDQALPTTTMDAAAVKFRDDLAGEDRDIAGEKRGPAWFRKRYPPKAAGGARRTSVA
jgi:hypothetical protein